MPENWLNFNCFGLPKVTLGLVILLSISLSSVTLKRKYNLRNLPTLNYLEATLVIGLHEWSTIQGVIGQVISPLHV